MKPVTERFPGEENHSEAWDWHFSKRFCTPYWQKRSKKPPETNTWYNMWYMLLTDYSKRRLTNSSDIFPALSGLQTVFAAFTQDQLLAGPFSNDLERGLLWEVDLFQINHRATPFRAPTWSWASVEGPVSWPFDINSEFIPGYKIQLVDHGTVSKAQKSEDHLGADTHGEVGEGTYIKLLGRWRSTGSWDEITIPTDSNSTHWYLYDHHGMTHATCSFDVGANTDHIHPHFQKGDWGLLQIATWDIYSHVDTTRVLYALILRSVPGVDELYERIGIAHIYTDDIATDAEILDWEVKTLKIV
ncbi:hypothetical protein H2200_005046 [Cladophialophora chaetospira]|uniref:Uncharacterized protein n=1 Tax=Cladophialophora chaetospira TaxID=386627 RepID=A0AA38XBC0_9EURO|nr:hypothetical protein H2200_005046 [Cladophialophora chaetospira]